MAAYTPGITLFYTDTRGSTHEATILTDNMVIFTYGLFLGKSIKLVDFLILAQGKEKIYSAPKPNVDILGDLYRTRTPNQSPNTHYSNGEDSFSSHY